jgi:CheY-like chemotaxis protein
VLVADDEEDVRLVARRLLQAYGFHVLLSSDGADAVGTFRDFSERVAVVVLDLNMPRMAGAEAFRELRRIRHDVRVILTSGYGYPEGPSGFAKGELSGFVRKPFSGEDLLSAVFAAVGG